MKNGAVKILATSRLVDTLDIDNIVVKPHPMKYAVDKIDCNFEDLHGKDSADSEVNQAEKSIVDYYKRFGFQRIGRTNYYELNYKKHKTAVKKLWGSNAI